MNKIKVNDEVVIISGKNKGKKGKVRKIFLDKDLIVVEGVNTFKKAMRPSQENPGGGYVEKELPLHMSKVALYSLKAKSPSRVGFKLVDGKKVRFLKKCGSVI